MAKTMAMTELRETLARRLDAIDSRVAELISPLTEAQLVWDPPDGGWSAARVLEHLTIAAESYFTPLRVAYGRARQSSAGKTARQWRSTVAGGLIAGSLERARPVRAPRIFRPPAQPRVGVRDAFAAAQRETGALLAESEGVDLMRARLSSPVSVLLRMNAGDVLRIMVVHVERHLGQIERLRARADFPS